MSLRLVFVFLLFPFLIQAQSFPLQDEFTWDDNFVNYKPLPDSLKDFDAVVLKEEVFIGEPHVKNLSGGAYIKKRVAIIINNEKGALELSKLSLPENFDLTNFPHYQKQGRFKDRKDPFIYKYNILYFAARVIRPNKKIVDIRPVVSSQKLLWVNFHGDHVYDYVTDLDLGQLKTGDILEYTYKAEINWGNKQQIIYPNSIYPKLDYNLSIVTHFTSSFRNVKQLYNHRIPSQNMTVNTEHKVGEEVATHDYHFRYLPGIRYPANAIAAFTLPNISLNHGAYGTLTSGAGNIKTSIILDYFDWSLAVDTTRKTKIYDKYHANLRKFISKFPEDKTDTTGNLFLSQLWDSLNKMKFVTAEELNHGEISQYSLLSSEQLLKGKLPEEFVYKNYKDFLLERKILYYDCRIIDRRYGVINESYRNHYEMERVMIVLPTGKSFKYYMPRFGGVKYFPDELPFYFEGTKCVVKTCYDCVESVKDAKFFFTTTPKSLSNENVRTENAHFKVRPDSFLIHATIKENLSGQYSTVLRHYYNNEIIDSTIPEFYFKKCIDKPHALKVSLKPSSSQKTFPFKHTYNCSEDILMGSKSTVDLLGWFSFPWSRSQFPQAPNHDFYMDFVCTDTYNYLFEFAGPTEVINLPDLSKRLSNDYFEITSNLVKQEENKYLLSVIVKVKQFTLPRQDRDKIIEFVNMLDEINNFKLQIKS